MKLAVYDDQRLGIVTENNRLVDVFDLLTPGTLSPHASITELIDKFDSIKLQLVEGLLKKDLKSSALSDVSLLPPIAPSMVVCTVDNYRAHGDEFATQIFPKPIFFLKPVSTLVGHNGTVILPQAAKRVDHELELGVVIGKQCHQVSAQEALSYVFGYTIFLDMSARDFRTIPYSWFSMKGWNTFGPVGPAIVTSDDIKDPHGLEMTLAVNDLLRMQGNTRNMVFRIQELIEAISEVTSLQPGDLIATGTIDGVGSVEENDKITATIDHIGTLSVTVARSTRSDKWHTPDFSTHYANYREQTEVDRGPDPIAP